MAAGKPPGGGRPVQRERVTDPVREAALAVLFGLEDEAVPAGAWLERAERSFTKGEDRSLFRALVGAVLRHRSRLDALLDSMLDRSRLADLPSPIRNTLRLGAAQLVLLDTIPAHAAVDTSVELAARHGHRGTSGLVNAILRRVSREGRARWAEWDRFDAGNPVDTLAVRYSHPAWLVRRWVERWGVAEAERVIAWNNGIPDYWIRLAPGATAPPAAIPGWIPSSARLAAGSHPAEQPGFSRGEWAIQDGAGILVGLLLPEVHGLVVDLCAAPGTKTGHLAERAVEGTRVVALDPSRGRVRRMERGVARQRGTGVRTGVRILPITGDGRRVPVRPPWDAVLIDAPCSNLGVLRRRIDLKWRAAEEEIVRLSALQAELLRSAAAGCAAGGHLVYSVCTTEPEETTEQRDRFFATHPGWTPAPLPGVIPEEARGREGEMLLVPGRLETDGGYAFLARRGETGD